MVQTQAEQYRVKVDDLLRAALAELEGVERKRLIMKAAYWHDVSLKAGAPRDPVRGPWGGAPRLRRA